MSSQSIITPASDSWSIDQDGFFRCHTHSGDHLWCDDLANIITAGNDARWLHTGIILQVPIFPTIDIFVPVKIVADEENFGESGLMVMEWQPDIGGLQRFNLGFWNPGDGARVIRDVILDLFRARLDPNEDLSLAGPILTRCPNTTLHSFRNERMMDEKASEGLNWKRACLWNMVFEGACTVCIEELQPDFQSSIPSL